MAAQVLGGRVHDQIGAQLKRPLDQRGGERAVDHGQRVRLVPCGADGGQVSNRQQRVRWRFEPQQVGVGGELEPARGVLDADADHAPPALRGTRGGQTRDSLIAVVAEPHGGTDRAAGQRPPRSLPYPRQTRQPDRPRGRPAAPRMPPRSGSRRRGCRHVLIRARSSMPALEGRSAGSRRPAPLDPPSRPTFPTPPPTYAP